MDNKQHVSRGASKCFPPGRPPLFIRFTRNVTCRSAVSPSLLLLSGAERKLEQPLVKLHCILDVLPLYRDTEKRATINFIA